MKDKIEALMAEIAAISAATKQDIEDARVRLLGKKGSITALFDDFRSVPAYQKREFGAKLNVLKNAALARIEELREAAENAEAGAGKNSSDDLSMPGETLDLGSRHPVSIVRQEIVDIFRKFGYDVAEGPEIEDDWHVFEALNFPPEHPAREMQYTFFVSEGEYKEGVGFVNPVLLRTHTSSVQSRVMEKTQPPIRIICPGRVYRNEAISYRAHCFFHQVEALYVDKNVTFADLKQTLLYFAKEMFGPETKIRPRHSYFPFTEPSAEMDISCNLCGGKGCNFCKHTGWVEILGCGMVDPNLLEACGIDSKQYTSFALGIGVERITNLKYQVKALRMFSENDVRFLEEFESAH